MAQHILNDYMVDTLFHFLGFQIKIKTTYLKLLKTLSKSKTQAIQIRFCLAWG